MDLLSAKIHPFGGAEYIFMLVNPFLMENILRPANLGIKPKKFVSNGEAI